MKQLSKALPNTQNIAKLQESLIQTHSDGQGIKGGNLITQSVKPLLDHSKGLQTVDQMSRSVLSLLTQKRPKKCWGEYRRVDVDEHTTQYYRKFRYEMPECTEDEKQIIEMSLMPLNKEAIVDMLSRYLCVHKRMQVDGEKRQILLADYANMLHGVKECVLMRAIYFLMHEDTSVWFPPCSVVKTACDKFDINWPKELEGEEKV